MSWAGITQLLREPPPPHAASETDERQKLARWALWDIVEGVRLWEMWLRQSWNEVRRRYKRTLLGPMWVTVSLVIFAVALSFIWAGLWKMKVTEFLPFLLSGLLPWGVISGNIGEACAVFLAGEGLMKSRQFPYTALIYGVLARNTIILGHNLLGYFPIAVICGVALTWKTALLLPGLVLVILNCAWMAILVAVFCLRFRDFQQLVASLLQIAMFVTPVFWTASQLQGKRAILVDLNLFHHMVDVVRQPLLGQAAGLTSYAVCVAAILGGWSLAFILLARKRHRLAYWF